MLGSDVTARLCACRNVADDADGGFSTVGKFNPLNLLVNTIEGRRILSIEILAFRGDFFVGGNLCQA